MGYFVFFSFVVALFFVYWTGKVFNDRLVEMNIDLDWFYSQSKEEQEKLIPYNDREIEHLGRCAIVSGCLFVVMLIIYLIT